MGANDQTFISEKTEWSVIHSEGYDGIGLKKVRTGFRNVRAYANKANEDIAASGLGVSSITVALTLEEIEQFCKWARNLKFFSKDVHQDAIDLIDEPFAEGVRLIRERVMMIASHGLVDGDRNITDDVADILKGVNAIDNHAKFDAAELAELEKNLGKDVVDGLKEAEGAITADKGVYYYNVDGYWFMVSRGGDSLHVVSITTPPEGCDPNARKYVEDRTEEYWKDYNAKVESGKGFHLTKDDTGVLPLDLIDEETSSGVGKAIEIVSYGEDITNNCRDEYGNWIITPSNVQRAATDIVVDVVYGAYESTLITFAPLFGIPGHFAVTKDLDGDGKSKVDELKDTVDKAVDRLLFGWTA